MDQVHQILQREAQRIASGYRLPEFYARFKAPLALARRLYYHDPLLIMVRERIEETLRAQEHLGHGMFHSMRVSHDSAALVYLEMESSPVDQTRLERLMVLALIAGLFHDICRGEDDHARAGAREAARILKDYPLSQNEIGHICKAIENHEAFVQPIPCRNPSSQLMSDCLYDADKFRWGPDNFTHTLWHMASHQGLTPLDLIDRFSWGMNGIMRIRDTFRSTSGRHYGPEMIELGIAIGKEIYRYLVEHYGDGATRE